MTTNKPEVVAYGIQIDTEVSLDRVYLHRDEAERYFYEEEIIGLIFLSDYERLQAECEKLRKFADQYRRLIELGEDFQWENIIRVEISDFPSRAAAIDAAMQETNP